MLLHNFVNCNDHVTDVRICHPRRQRQRYKPLVFPESHGIIPRSVTILFAIVGVQVDRNEVHRGSDVTRLQFLYEQIATYRKAVEIQAKRVEVPRVFCTILLDWRFSSVHDSAAVYWLAISWRRL